jgi:hypothetical protein
MGWLGGDRELNADRGDEASTLDDAEIIELDDVEPAAPRAPAEVAYMRDRRDPTSTAGIWRALEGL